MMLKVLALLLLTTVPSLGTYANEGGPQGFQERPITVIAPYAAGGSADILVRIIALRMRESLGKPVVVSNRPGASGSIGTEALARAIPDGHTFGLGTWSTHVANGAVYALPYDVLSDFQPIALIASSPLLLVAKKDMPAKNLQELIAWLKANPDEASQATNGPGSVMHLAGVLFKRETGTRFQFVPYRGAGSAMQDLQAGHIALYFGLPADILPQFRAGRIKVYAVAATSRLAAAPEIPTADEAGVSGLHVSAWFGLWAPKGTQQTIVGKLNAAVVEALADVSLQKRLRDDLNLDVPPREQQTSAALGAYQMAEIQKWWPLIKAAGIKAE
jgi:tripartite-type tricarboxylate transporter receptor subunit TctC